MNKRVEKQIIKNKDIIKQLDKNCFLTKNLYNFSNYILRQRFFKKKKLPSTYKLINDFTRGKQNDFIALPNNVSQQVIIQLEKQWKSFFRALKEYKNNASKFEGRPKPPKYKEKDGKFMIIFTKPTLRMYREGYIHFVKNIISEIPTSVDFTKIKQVRILPQATCYKMEVVYEDNLHEIEREELKLEKQKTLSIDIGLNNLATCVNNVGTKPFIINGRSLKSINQYYNKKKAKYQSKLPNNTYTSNKIKKLSLKRSNLIDNYLHHASKYIVKYCLINKIGTIVIGHNKGWKQEINMSKRNNQNFVSIPFNKLIQRIQYKAEYFGINVVIHEESYTSKIDHFAGEEMKHQENYLGKRKKRGLFQSSIGKLINADVNGAVGIMRKVIQNTEKSLDIGLMLNPIKINLF